MQIATNKQLDSILSFDLSEIVKYATKKKPSLIKFDISALELEYRRYMILAAKSSYILSVPSAAVDELWHAHLLHNKSYERFCKILGKTIYHSPHNEETTEERKQEGKINLIAASVAEFGKNVFAIGNADCRCFQTEIKAEDCDSECDTCNVDVSCGKSCDGSND